MSTADGASLPLAVLEDGHQAMRICNACRYCEGFCAVFPAMAKRLDFSPSDLSYLANLCHDCGECYYSCQYAPPHEFGLNLPRVLAKIRRESYARYAWPSFLPRFLGRTGPAVVVSVLLAPVIVFLATLVANDPAALFSAHPDESGSFYRVISHTTMVWGFGAAGGFVLLALAMGFRRFWRDAGHGAGSWLDVGALAQALRDGATLRYLGGASHEGCAYPHEEASTVRRWLHHATFYGFVLCFASTSTAAVYHNVLGWIAPYELTSLPVVLGSLGGLGLLVGPLGLLLLKRARDPEPVDAVHSRMDVAFLVLLFLTSATGLLLLVLRETPAMGVTLAVHLGVVLGLFLAMPYGKFVHGLYRLGALIRFAKEGRGS